MTKSGWLAVAFVATVAGCGQTPVQQSSGHLQRAPEPKPEASIPPPVQLAPVLPKPTPTARAETYSVVVNNVRVQELLFALARDARINVDIHPDVTGTVTLNAIDQTLPQLLSRISRQVDMRYELVDGSLLSVMRDSPFLRVYKIDYLSAARNVKMQSTASTQFGGSGGTAGSGGAAATGPSGTGASATVDVASENKLWDSIVQNVKDILRETDKVIPRTQTVAAAPAPAAGGAAPAAAAPAATMQQAVDYIEVASVIANRESGILYVRASGRQHERVQEFLDQVMAGAKRQVLIEATVAEVQLNNDYQRGIDWSRMRSGGTGFQIQQSSIGTPAAINTSAFIIGYANASANFTSAIKLLESFGSVKVLSSPKLSVLNNQTALLRVTRDIVYFQITPSSAPVTITSGGVGAPVVPIAFTTTPQVAAEGFMMAVLPQINEADFVVLSVRPTIRRRVGDATDPNPALVTTPNLIPIFETREFDSILRLQSGEMAMLGGLMQDSASNVEDTIPGVREVPGFGALFSQRRDTNVKTELVIFLRATVIRDASIDGDFRAFRGFVPGEDFMRQPNPARSTPRPPDAQ